MTQVTGQAHWITATTATTPAAANGSVMDRGAERGFVCRGWAR